MIFYVISGILITLIYGMSLLAWKGFKDVPPGNYKDALWRFKKLEFVEKGIISVFFLLAIFAVPWFGDNNGMVTLIAVAGIITVEKFFGDWFRKSFLCPKCKGPIWIGNFYVRLKPLHKCGHCGHELYTIEKENDEEE